MTAGVAYAEDGLVLHHGDVLATLAGLEADSVDCVVTSPPYFAQRRYSGEQTTDWAPQGYGCEPTPELYLDHTLIVLRAIRRVLKRSGVVWLVIGDGYAGSGKGAGDTKSTNRGNPHSRPSAHQRQGATSQRKGRANVDEQRTDALRGATPGLKPKDLLAMPWRVGLAAQADRWWLRADVIWSKPNAMPESVTDRPTRSHEYVLLLTKSARYYWDRHAVREPLVNPNRARADVVGGTQGAALHHSPGAIYTQNGVKKRADKQRGHSHRHDGFNDRWDAMSRKEQVSKGANIRSVWTVSTQPNALPHFAAFPEELARRCILAACPPDGTVLDPFAGTGTTLVVARDLGRRAIGVEISEAYCRMACDRLLYGVRGAVAKASGQLALGPG